MQMGLGKSVCTLTAIDQLMYDAYEVEKVLVIAPKMVADNTWTTECQKWDHLQHLRISKVLGTEVQRKNALQAKADIYVINRENVPWLVSYYSTAFPFDMVVIDELSSFKSAKATRFKALKAIRPKIKRLVGLTGTPAPNSLLDLWPQIYLLDQGERLGKTIGGYRERYFRVDSRIGHIATSHKIRQGVEQAIYNRISDICISMKAKDYLQLPQRIDRTVPINFSKDLLKQYRDFEKEQVLALEDITQISAVNAVSLTGKLLQFANGAIYDENKQFHSIHENKLQALEEIVESANGQPVLVFYSYKHDLVRIQQYLKTYKPKALEKSQDVDDWNAGKIPLLIAHPASAGHGLNMQAGGNIIVWFGLPWSLELYQQANARLDRQGQTKPVIVHHLVATGTVDEDVVKALSNKAKMQDALMEAVKARIKKYLKQAA